MTRDLLKEFVFGVAKDLQKQKAQRASEPDNQAVPHRVGQIGRLTSQLRHLEAARSYVLDAKVEAERAIGYGRECEMLKDMYFELNERVSELQVSINKARVEMGDKEGRIWT